VKPFLDRPWSFTEWVEKSMAEQRRADAAEERAERLGAKLRDLGIDPE
jgi:hypothetical protein